MQRLPILLREVKEGEIRIPRFQRPFVWTPEQQLLLMRSIYEGLPIGSILVWRTRDHDLESYDRLGHLPLQWKGEPAEIKQYLLDGHQRLSTLYAALGEGLLEPETIPNFPGNMAEPEQESRPIYFDLEAQEFLLQPPQGEVPRTWLPLSILFDPYKLYDFEKELLKRGTDRALVNRAENLSSQFKEYSVPVVPIVAEDLDLVTESFLRINTAGLPMSEVNMVSALTWSPEFDLNERIQEIKDRLGEVGWHEIEERLIFNTCKTALDLDIYRNEAKSMQKALKETSEVLETAATSLEKAARFLSEYCNICGPGTLPYSVQIVLLADAVRASGGNLKEPLSLTLGEALRVWVWLTTYTEYFASVNPRRFRQALEHLRHVASDGEDPRPPDLATIKVGTFRRFDFRAARSRAMVLRMAGLNPRTAEGEEQHPYQLLADHGRNATPMLIPSREVDNRSVAEGVENRVIIDPRAFTQLRRVLREDPLSCDPEVLRSHAIDEQAAEALAQSDLRMFLTSRRRRLLEIEREFVEQFDLEYAIAD